ncbi:MAG: hypothetical protein IJ156_09515 [Bacteroidales bacterium]|nr:hypothetical protein [Bacteroidales bacterium]
MRRSILLAALAALSLAACSPQTLTLSVDMRYPSKSGVDLSRKTMSIVYMDDGTADSTFSNAVASSLARSLEKDYFRGEENIGVYKIPSDSVSLDLMHRLVMDTGDDVVFLLGPPAFGEVSLGANTAVQNPKNVDSAFVAQAQIPYNARLFVYDSMDKDDNLRIFRGSSVLRTPVYNNGVTAKEYLASEALKVKDSGADMVGAQMSNRFVPTWKTEGYSLYYYDGFETKWVDAAYLAYDFQWKKAADIWMALSAAGSYTKRACACYNTALAFYMMGDLSIATKWLDRADGYEPLSLSPGLRKRIEARK